MKQMGDLLPHDPTLAPRDELDRMLQRESQQSIEKLQKLKDIKQLWQLMSSMYGHKWTSAYGDEPDPDKVWQATLFDCNWEAIQNGLSVLVKRGSEWPPAAPEFRKLCLGIEEGVNVARAPSVEATAKEQGLRGITHKRSEEQINKTVSAISNLRGLLNGTR